MSEPVLSRTVATLALIALASAVVVVVPAVRRRLRSLSMTPELLWLAALVALTSTAGSLIYSEGFGFEPCRLCWYQRIAMYPLVVVLGVAAWRRDPAGRRFGLPLAVIGAGISLYHYFLQAFPALDGGACAVGVPCTARYVEVFGFVSIPFMAGAGFALIAALLTVIEVSRSQE